VVPSSGPVRSQAATAATDRVACRLPGCLTTAACGQEPPVATGSFAVSGDERPLIRWPMFPRFYGNFFTHPPQRITYVAEWVQEIAGPQRAHEAKG